MVYFEKKNMFTNRCIPCGVTTYTSLIPEIARFLVCIIVIISVIDEMSESYRLNDDLLNIYSSIT